MFPKTISNEIPILKYFNGVKTEDLKTMKQNKTMTQKEITEFIFENLDELATTDLIQLCRVAKEINEKRTEQCRKDGLFGEYEGFFDK